jgi:hypothetical protein
MTGTYAAAVQRILIGRAVATAGGLLALIGTFLPWLRSGARLRNSYEIFALVDRLGISESSLVGWGVRLWPVVPLLLVLAVALLWFAPRVPATVVVVLTVLYAGGVSVVVNRAASNSLLSVTAAPIVTICGLAVLLLGTLLANTFDDSGPVGGREPSIGG